MSEFIQKEQQHIEERRCPLISWQQTVECADCGSPNFNLTVDLTRRRTNSVPGRCDECGGFRGRRIQPKKPN